MNSRVNDLAHSSAKPVEVDIIDMKETEEEFEKRRNTT
jgi:hypothetical protein